MMSLASMTAGTSAYGAKPASELSFGLQLYSLLDALREDMPGCLRRVARMGYRHVEMITFMGKTGAELRTLLDDSGLACHSIQVLGQAVPGTKEPSLADLNFLIDQAKALGVRYVVLPSFPPPAATGAPGAGEDYGEYFRRAARLMNGDAWRALADELNAKGEALAAAGLTLGYHNHNPEFTPLDGTNGMAILLERVDPKLATFELDVAWAKAAGVDPADLMRKHPGRFGMIHVKDLTAQGVPNFDVRMSSVSVGKGIMDWKTVLKAAKESGVQKYYVEQEPPFAISAEQEVEQSLRYLNGLHIG